MSNINNNIFTTFYKNSSDSSNYHDDSSKSVVVKKYAADTKKLEPLAYVIECLIECYFAGINYYFYTRINNFTEMILLFV